MDEMKLTKAQIDYMRELATGRYVSHTIMARILGKPTSSLSLLRNCLLRDGLINAWSRWDYVPSLTDKGRAALAENQP